jgi:hypothetical protein
MGDDLLMLDEAKSAEGENLEVRVSHVGRVSHPAVCRDDSSPRTGPGTTRLMRRGPRSHV